MCLNMSDPLGGTGRATNEGPVHGLSWGTSLGLLPFYQNLGLTLSSAEEDDNCVVIVHLLSSHFCTFFKTCVTEKNAETLD